MRQAIMKFIIVGDNNDFHLHISPISLFSVRRLAASSLHSVGQVIYGTFPIATHWGNRFLLD